MRVLEHTKEGALEFVRRGLWIKVHLVHMISTTEARYTQNPDAYPTLEKIKMENKVLRTKSEIISSLDGGNSLRCTKHIIRQNW